MTDLYQLSATELAKAICTQTICAVEAVEACFERIDRHNSHLKAFITLCYEQAKTAAIEADRAVQQGWPLKLLHGIPIAIKDLTATAGIRTTYGSLLYHDHIPAYDDLCVARLRDAGAIILGKTSTPEFGMGTGTTNRVIGTTVNPYDHNRTCGDSSGGSAVAVATGMCYVAQGSDLGGSVRTPASFCGVVGLRPAIGRIPRVPKALQWESLATDGILARTVEDAALMLSAMAGADVCDPVSIAQAGWSVPEFGLEGLPQTRVGFSCDLGIAVIEHDVEAVFQQAIEAIARICPTVKPAHPDCSGAQAAFETLRAALVWHQHGHRLKVHPEQLTETVRWEIEQGRGITAAQWLQAEAQRSRIFLNFMEFFQHYDVLATVSASVLPFPIHQTEVLEINGVALRNIIDYLNITYTISLTGLPALSIPCGWTASGLPVGMQLVGKPYGEADLLRFAFFLQEALDFRHRWASPSSAP